MPNTFILRVDIFHQLSVIKILILYPCRNQYFSFFLEEPCEQSKIQGEFANLITFAEPEILKNIVDATGSSIIIPGFFYLLSFTQIDIRHITTVIFLSESSLTIDRTWHFLVFTF